MPSSSAKSAETASYDVVRAAPFTRIHGRPTRHDYETLKKEASDLASEVDNLTFDWCRDPATEEEYGLLAEIIGEIEYTHLTNLAWQQEVEPSSYDPAITAATVTHMRKRMEEEWEEKREAWFTRKGFLRGVTMNMRDALDEQYYSQLKNITTACVTPRRSKSSSISTRVGARSMSKQAKSSRRNSTPTGTAARRTSLRSA
jgi:hypothetical protein